MATYTELFLFIHAGLFRFIEWGLFLFMNVELLLFMNEGRGAVNCPTTTPTNPETIINTTITATSFLFIEPSNPAPVLTAALVKNYG